MTEQEKEELKIHIEKVIQEKVNGKIDSFRNSFENHITRIEKVLTEDNLQVLDKFFSGLTGVRIVRTILMYVAATIITLGAAVALFKSK